MENKAERNCIITEHFCVILQNEENVAVIFFWDHKANLSKWLPSSNTAAVFVTQLSLSSFAACSGNQWGVRPDSSTAPVFFRSLLSSWPGWTGAAPPPPPKHTHVLIKMEPFVNKLSESDIPSFLNLKPSHLLIWRSPEWSAWRLRLVQ